MPRPLAGLVVGQLKVLCIDESKPRGAHKSIYWLCKCECGNPASVDCSNLTRAKPIRSCGCLPVGPPQIYATRELAKAALFDNYRRWLSKHPGRTSQYSQARRARKNKQTCSCCTTTAKNNFYEARKQGMEVDHIIPLAKGGLHCVKNFQYLTRHENRTKGARLLAA